MEIQDGDAKFEVKDMRYKAIVDLIYPVGTVIAFAKDDNPPVLKYGEWEEVPAGRFLQSAFGEHKAGESVEAGLPNITGSTSIENKGKNFGNFTQEGGTEDGAIYLTQSTEANSGVRSGEGQYGNVIHFNASRSNAIYGASNTVQPPAYIVHFYERVK